MKIIKEELDNLERIINADDQRIDAVMNLNPVMADALVDSEKYDKQVEDEMQQTKKIANKDKAFLGRHSADKVVSSDDLKKMHLSEELFEDATYGNDIHGNTIGEYDLDGTNIEDAPDVNFKYHVRSNGSGVVYGYNNKRTAQRDAEQMNSTVEVVDNVNESTKYNPEEEEIFWKLAKEKMSDEAYKELCKQFGRSCDINESKEATITYDEAKEFFAEKGIDLPKDIFNMILNSNGMKNDMIMSEEVPSKAKRKNKDGDDWNYELDLWDIVYTELYGNITPSDDLNFKFKFNTAPGRGRLGKPGYRNSMGIDADGNIQVWAADESGLALAKKICDGYNVPYRVDTRSDRAVLTALIPEYDLGKSYEHESLDGDASENNIEENVNEQPENSAKLIDESSVCSDGDCMISDSDPVPEQNDEPVDAPMPSDDVDDVIADVVKEASDDASDKQEGIYNAELQTNDRAI